jgi:peptidoglycan/LPS O-acetylase OafA/YrhL
MDRGEKRVFGLDVLRAAAIALVILSHLAYLNPHWAQAIVPWLAGVMGVEIFFVLSGYLIGGIIIRLMRQGRFNRPRDLGHFWVSRWLRTLPSYYVFLMIICIAHGSLLGQLREHPEFLVFMQNLAWDAPRLFFGHSWSLAVEEWFYLVFPLLLFGSFALLRVPLRTSLLSCALILCAASFALRIWHGPEHNLYDFDASMRKWVVFRFDALMMGMLIAFARQEAVAFWQLLVARWWLTSALFVLICFAAAFGTNFLLTIPWLQLIFFPVVSASIALVLPRFVQWADTASVLKHPTVALAKCSYSVYLAHTLPLSLLERSSFFRQHSVFAAAASFGGIVVLSALGYFLIEAPVMRWRRHWDERYKARQTAAHGAPGP